jgi:hypothetical protein
MTEPIKLNDADILLISQALASWEHAPYANGMNDMFLNSMVPGALTHDDGRTFDEENKKNVEAANRTAAIRKMKTARLRVKLLDLQAQGLQDEENLT